VVSEKSQKGRLRWRGMRRQSSRCGGSGSHKTKQGGLYENGLKRDFTVSKLHGPRLRKKKERTVSTESAMVKKKQLREAFPTEN